MTALAPDPRVLADNLAQVPRAVVMTMGALHEGHARLLDAARESVGPNGQVVATIFVNPLQFGEGEDFDRYPRTFEADLALCEARGVDVVFAPSVEHMYADAHVTIDPGPIAHILEGAQRPGHFTGVLTIVAKLLHLTKADVALFGEKDYQQLTAIRMMVRALDFPVEVVGVPTVREGDGLAMSSRNRYLSDEERAAAVVVPRALGAGAAVALTGADAEEILQVTRDVLAQEPLASPDYVSLTDVNLGPSPQSGAARLLTAVRFGNTRLLDNVGFVLGGSA
ncbi:MAG: pantoate--beta-alanine ligase [Actinobacteria bacterium]|nr:pantoate--beta-alanine ligase [Actinomycetota bacterium]